MEITKVETLLTSPGRNYLIVKITTRSGIVGYGDATLNGRETVVKTFIDDYLAEWLEGFDSDRIEDIWRMLFKGGYWRGGPVMMSALAGVDVALWDIKGKRAGLPLYSLFGGKCRDRYGTYIHVHGTTDDELIEKCREKIKEGYITLRYSFDTPDPFRKGNFFRQPYQNPLEKRIEVGTLKKEEQIWDEHVYANDLLKVTEKLRAALGDHIGLIHDVHGRLSSDQAYRVAKALEPYHLLFLEDPVDSFNNKVLENIKMQSATPIALGELFNTISDCRDLIDKRLIDYIRIDISHYGGITPLLKLAAFAEIFDVKTAFHAPSDISPLAHAALAHVNMHIPNFGIQEYVEPDAEIKKVFRSPVRMADGALQIGDEAGLGVGVLEEAATELRYKPMFLPYLRDRTGAIQNW